MKRIAVGLWGGMPMDDLIGCITLADRAGYEAAFLIESYADQFCVLAACARETERIKLGTGVTTVFNRTPTSVAIAGATVDALSHGRFVLGLGAGHSEIVRMRDDVEPARPLPFERPLQRLRETEASKYTERDTPIFVGTHCTHRTALDLLDGAVTSVRQTTTAE